MPAGPPLGGILIESSVNPRLYTSSPVGRNAGATGTAVAPVACLPGYSPPSVADAPPLPDSLVPKTGVPPGRLGSCGRLPRGLRR